MTQAEGEQNAEKAPGNRHRSDVAVMAASTTISGARMPYVIPDLELAVFFSPKSAGTTIRAVMFELENGRPFEPYYLQGELQDANLLLRNNRFRLVDHEAIAGFHRVAVIRDPVKRFLSAYSNRVIHYRELSEAHAGEALRERGLDPDPDIDLFAARIEDYRAVSVSIRRHTQRQDFFLGGDPGYFHRVFRVEDLPAFPRYLEERYGRGKLGLPRLQDGGPKLRVEDLASETLERIKAFVAADIAYKLYPAYQG